jgi:hypothetical protein
MEVILSTLLSSSNSESFLEETAMGLGDFQTFELFSPAARVPT